MLMHEKPCLIHIFSRNVRNVPDKYAPQRLKLRSLRIRLALSESSLSTRTNFVSLAILNAISEDFNQTARTGKLNLRM